MDEKSLKYTKTHEWLGLENDIAAIGLTNHAQGELGDIVFVETKEIGETLEQFEECGSIESVKAVSDIRTPVSGEVVGINNILEEKPEAINKDPYGDGWIIKIKISNKSEIDSLMNYEQYIEFLEKGED